MKEKQQSIVALVRDSVCNVDSIAKTKSGTYVARKGFFYTHGYNEDKFAANVRGQLRKLGIEIRQIDTREHWKPFRGGASVARSSHWSFEFQVVCNVRQAVNDVCDILRGGAK